MSYTMPRPMVKPGDRVVFTLGPLGLMHTPYDTSFVEKPFVSAGDEGLYVGPPPNPLMALDQDWHVIQVGELVCTCHRSMFQPA